jgi:hypothetical protein
MMTGEPMRIEGAVYSVGDPATFTKEAWCRFVETRPELRGYPTRQARNPFSGGMMDVRPMRDARDVVIEDRVIGEVYWSMSEEPLVNVSIEPCGLGLVTEWAAALGGEFRPDTNVDTALTVPVSPEVLSQRVRASLQKAFGKEVVVLTRLLDESGAIAVLAMGNGDGSNAWIIDSCGVVRCKVEIPGDFKGGGGFSDAYYVNGELTAIFGFSGRDFAFVIDESTGRVIRNYETR